MAEDSARVSREGVAAGVNGSRDGELTADEDGDGRGDFLYV